MPPSLAWWASSLQLSGLNPGQAEIARQFLSRAAQLDHRLRVQMAYRIAGDVVSHIAPPPPPGAPPELVLAAVLAERHRRELARLGFSVPPQVPAAAPAPWAPAGAPYPGPDAQAVPWPEPEAPPAAARPQEGPNSGGFSPPG
jgi:hypothetical protein